MNQNLELLSTTNMSEEEWLLHRQNGIGGSECGTVMKANRWETRIELYDRKIGLTPLVKHSTESMFWGNVNEATIAKCWEYYDGSIQGMIARQALGKEHRFRRNRRFNYIVRNPKYPHILGNLDRLMNKGQVRVFDGALLEKEGILECKTVMSWALLQWESEIPPQYIFQTQQYLGITELDYCEIALLKDGNSFDVIPFDFNQIIFDSIVRETDLFWGIVLTGRMLLNELKMAKDAGNFEQVEYLQQKLDANEPVVTPEEAVGWQEYINKKYLAVDQVIKGGEEQFEAAKNYMRCNKNIKEVTDEKAYYATLLKNFMKECDVLDLGDNGEVTWKADKNGTRSLKTTKLIL